MQQVFFDFRKPKTNTVKEDKPKSISGKKLRFYQKESLEAKKNYFKTKEGKRPVTVMATGCGKTFTFANLIQQMQKRTLVLAHRKELLYQGATTIVDSSDFTKSDVDVVLQSNPRKDAKIWVASVQTLFAGKGRRLDDINPELIIVDECHHATEESRWYSNIVLEKFADVPCGGYTATATRRTKKERESFARFWDDIVYQYSLRQAIMDGYLSDLRYFEMKSSVSLEHIKTAKGDYNKKELSEAVNVFSRNQAMVEKWKEVGGGKTVVFCVDKKHAEAVWETFKKNRVEAYIVTGESKDRDKVLRYFHKAKIHQNIVIVSIDVLNEGWDCDNLRVVILGRPTKSQIIYLQQLGRGTRKSNRPGEQPKDVGIIIDVADNANNGCCDFLTTAFNLDRGIDCQGQNIVELLNKQNKIIKQQERKKEIERIELEKQEEKTRLQLSKILFSMPFEIEKSKMAWFSPEENKYFCQISKKDFLVIWEKKELETEENWEVWRNRKLIAKWSELKNAISFCEQLVQDKFMCEFSFWNKEKKKKLNDKKLPRNIIEKIKKINPSLNPNHIDRETAEKIISIAEIKNKKVPTTKMAYFLCKNGFSWDEVFEMSRKQAQAYITKIKKLEG